MAWEPRHGAAAWRHAGRLPPGRAAHQLFSGYLGFGAAPGGVDQSFTMREGTLEGAINVSLLAGHMAEAAWIELRSFGTSFGGAALGVAVGGSPLKDGNENDSVPGEATTTRYSGLLAADNDTVDEAYTRVLGSAAALRSTFQDDGKNARRVEIPAPFAHLNQTPGRRLVEDGPKPYFPCNAASQRLLPARPRLPAGMPSSAPTFETLTCWLAQAPGPNIAGEQAMAIENAVGMAVTMRDRQAAALRAPRSARAWGAARRCSRSRGSWRGGTGGTAIGYRCAGVTLLGSPGYRPARTGDDGGGGSGDGPAKAVGLHGQQAVEPKTYYGGGGQKPYETVVPIQYGVAELPPQGVGRAAAEMEVPPAAYWVYEMVGDNACNSR
ncbi:hypothetical protein DL764_005128 [Monosporascus ibericus]|uniref:Uncharacterized protein n=1 Tax=Monosporascus ibericus TaxID=155417 RepID=A0A4Q4TDN7_9PEZI|nr:hypothetical protein DL764_005128 [Monosporascus ibericus]